MAHPAEMYEFDTHLVNELQTKNAVDIKNYIMDNHITLPKEADPFMYRIKGILRENKKLDDVEREQIVNLLKPKVQVRDLSAEMKKVAPPPASRVLSRDTHYYKRAKFSTVKITPKLRKYITRCGYRLIKISKKKEGRKEGRKEGSN